MSFEDPGVNMCFVVKIDDTSLGAFNSCQGLGIDMICETWEEGGTNESVRHLPTRLSYPNIKLTRPLTSETEHIARWFADMVNVVKPQTAEISALRADGSLVARWGLLDVIPKHWSGPQLVQGEPEIATEELEIAHHGFIDVGTAKG